MRECVGLFAWFGVIVRVDVKPMRGGVLWMVGAVITGRDGAGWGGR